METLDTKCRTAAHIGGKTFMHFSLYTKEYYKLSEKEKKSYDGEADQFKAPNFPTWMQYVHEMADHLKECQHERCQHILRGWQGTDNLRQFVA